MINEAGFDLIKEFERCKLKAYLDTLANPPVWTVGWGQTGPGIDADTVWTQERADSALVATVTQFGMEVRSACIVRPNPNQFAAMVSLAYNIGLGYRGSAPKKGERPGFRQSSVLRLHNEGKFAEAANAFAMWNKAGGKVRAGLTRRRAAEAALYLTPTRGEEQTTRATPEAKDPETKPPVAAIAAGAGAALTAAQQAVAQISSIWDGLSEVGISPHVLISVLGITVVVTLCWFIYDQRKRRAEGDR
jgi:lysozyme